jgi:hypothetical protein
MPRKINALTVGNVLLILILRGKLIKNSKYNEHFMGSVYN